MLLSCTARKPVTVCRGSQTGKGRWWSWRRSGRRTQTWTHERRPEQSCSTLAECHRPGSPSILVTPHIHIACLVDNEKITTKARRLELVVQNQTLISDASTHWDLWLIFAYTVMLGPWPLTFWPNNTQLILGVNPGYVRIRINIHHVGIIVSFIFCLQRWLKLLYK